MLNIDPKSPMQTNAFRFFLPLALAIVISGCQEGGEPEAAEQNSVPEATPVEALSAEELHQSLLTLDTHIDIPTILGSDEADPGLDGPMQVDLPKMRSGGLDSGFFIVYVGQGEVTPEGYALAYEQAMAKYSGIERMLERYPEEIALATSPDELEALVDEGKLVAAIGVENAFPIGPNFEHLQEFYDRGARYMSITHFGHNHFGDSSVGRGDTEDYIEPVNEGLSDLGKSLVDQLNQLGVMVDISHTSPSTTIQTAEYSAAPIIASHSGVRALYDHPRNMLDEEIIAVAEGGGVIQTVAFDGYMRELPEENQEAVAQIREELDFEYSTATQEEISELRNRVAELNSQWPRASVATLVDHIDYIVELVGIDHAGISSDFGGGGGIQGWDHIGETLAVTEELMARDYSLEDIEKIWSGNLLRVWREVEQVSQSLATGE